jgi:hypothetical protein
MVLQGHYHHPRTYIWNTDLAIILFDIGYQFNFDLGQQQKTAANPGSL